jgi:hypothetical protein
MRHDSGLFEAVDQDALSLQRALIDPVANKTLLVKRHARANPRIVAVDFAKQQAAERRKWDDALDGGVLRGIDADQCGKGILGRKRESRGGIWRMTGRTLGCLPRAAGK